jgi:hypothetical protein
MYVSFTPQILPLLVSSVIGLVLASYGWRNRLAAGATAFMLLQLSLVEIAMAEALVLTVSDPAIKQLVTRWDVVGTTLAPTAWLGFVLCYTGAARLGPWRLTALLALEPLVVLALAATNVDHHLIWQSIAYVGGVGDGMVVIDGGAASFAAAYAYGAGGIGLAIMALVVSDWPFSAGNSTPPDVSGGGKWAVWQSPYWLRRSSSQACWIPSSAATLTRFPTACAAAVWRSIGASCAIACWSLERSPTTLRSTV